MPGISTFSSSRLRWRRKPVSSLQNTPLKTDSPCTMAEARKHTTESKTRKTIKSKVIEQKNKRINLQRLSRIVTGQSKVNRWISERRSQTFLHYPESRQRKTKSTDAKPRAISSLLEYCRGAKEEEEFNRGRMIYFWRSIFRKVCIDHNNTRD